MDAEGIIKIGPAMEFDGKEWDECGRCEIAQIFIWHEARKICGIQFQYVENGNLVLGDLHGATFSWKFDSVQLNYPSEYITSISGHYCNYNRSIISLKISTNEGHYGTFGCNGDLYLSDSDPEFLFKMGQGRQFHGFFGSADNNGLTSIGVYLKPATTLGALTGAQG